MRPALLILAACTLVQAVDRKAIFPPSAKPIGPFSPGIAAGDYLYVSGQGARDAQGNLPAGIDAQTRQCLENIKTIVEAAGLTMDHIVYTHTYLTVMDNYAAMNAAYATFFKDPLPARSTMGVTRMPLDTPVEISAIAFRDKAGKRPLTLSGKGSSVPLSAGIVTPDRIFFSGILGRDSVTGVTPSKPTDQLAAALARLDAGLKAAKIDSSAVVHLNAYRTAAMDSALLERALRAKFPGTAISFVEAGSLPFQVSVGITAVAVRDSKLKRVFNSAGYPLCASAGDTVYCAAHEGTDAADALHAIDAGLKALGSNLTRALANTVYIDDVDHFQTMNAAYGLAFPPPPPARTTVQPVRPGAKLKISVVAVR